MKQESYVSHITQSDYPIVDLYCSAAAWWTVNYWLKDRMFFTLLVNSVQASYQLRKTQKSWYKPLDFVQTLSSMAGWQLGLGDGND